MKRAYVELKKSTTKFHACMMFLAVLSSLLNLMRGEISVTAVEACWEIESLELLVMHLLPMAGVTAAHCKQLE